MRLGRLRNNREVLDTKLSSSVNGKQHFAELVSAEEMESILKGFVPQNTAKNMKWMVSTFQQ